MASSSSGSARVASGNSSRRLPDVRLSAQPTSDAGAQRGQRRTRAQRAARSRAAAAGPAGDRRRRTRRAQPAAATATRTSADEQRQRRPGRQRRAYVGPLVRHEVGQAVLQEPVLGRPRARGARPAPPSRSRRSARGRGRRRRPSATSSGSTQSKATSRAAAPTKSTPPARRTARGRRGPARRPRPGGAVPPKVGLVPTRSPPGSLAGVRPPGQPPGVHAVGRAAVIARVGRGSPSGSRARGRACRPRRPAPRPGVRPAERRGGTGDVALGEALPDVRRRPPWCRRRAAAPPAAKPCRAPASRSVVDVAGRAVAEAEVLADVHLGGVQASTSTRRTNSSGSQSDELAGERQHQHGVDPALARAARAGARGWSAAAARSRGGSPSSGAGRRSPPPSSAPSARPRPRRRPAGAGARGARRRSCRPSRRSAATVVAARPRRGIARPAPRQGRGMPLRCWAWMRCERLRAAVDSRLVDEDGHDVWSSCGRR